MSARPPKVKQDGRLRRNPVAIVLLAGQDLRIIIPPERELVFSGRDAELARELLETAAVGALGSDLAGPEDGRSSNRVLSVLVREGVLLSGEQEEDRTGMAPLAGRRLRVLYGISAGADATRAYRFLDALVAAGQADVRIVLTENAQRFVPPDALRWLYGDCVYTDLFDSRSVHHVSLASWADAIIVAPATASFVCRLASGLYTDLLAATVAVSSCPVILAPSMNPAMWSRQAVRKALRELREEGFFVLMPGLGREVAAVDSGEVLGATGVEPQHLPALVAHVMKTYSPRGAGGSAEEPPVGD